MREIKEKAYAKLNISLDVMDSRPDGYHDMLMVMQTVTLWDDIHIVLNSEGKMSASSNLRFIPADERNLAVKAALRFFRELGDKNMGAHIDMQKRIPVGAGMAGGSADAAAVLRGLNKLCERPFSLEKLMELGADVGSDVPFCVMGGTALAQGRGEILSPLPPMPECSFVICKPEFSISTPELFKKLDACPMRRHPDTQGIIQALGDGDLVRICRRMYNVFEDVDDRRMRSVGEIKGALLDNGAISAMMTGTGSAVFGVYEDETAANKALEAMEGLCPFNCVAKPVSIEN